MHYFSTILLLLFIQTFSATCCIEHERDALLEFKASVHDESGRLASWRDGKCCNWAGIRCSNRTGHVVKLNLRNTNVELIDDYKGAFFNWNYHPSLTGKISPSLLFLSDLKHLDLSFNNFTGNEFPNFVGIFRNLKYLNLSNTGLSGKIHPQLGNLSRLLYFDLGNDHLFPGFILNIDTWWLSNMRSLKYMDMSGVVFKDSNDWVEILNNLSSLEVLILSDNNLTQISNAHTFVNFTSLKVLDISNQKFNTTLPNWVGSLHSLTVLSLKSCHLVGPLPPTLSNLTSLNKLELNHNSFDGMVPPLHNLTNLTYLSLLGMNIEGDIRKFLDKLSNYTLGNLEYLDLSSTNLTGTLTGWIRDMTRITYLRVGQNNLHGSIPTDVKNLTNLAHLDLSYNSLTGLLLETHLTGLLKLKYLDLRGTNITILFGTDWTPSFQLNTLWLSSNKLGPKFPSWIRTQVQIEDLDLSDTGINDSIPDWFWSLSSLRFLRFSNNVLRGKLPASLVHMTKLVTIDLSNNWLSGEIPFLHSSLDVIDLSSNSLSGHLPHYLLNINVAVNLANNNLSGVVPSSLNCSVRLVILKLENNSLTGEFPFDLQFCRGLQLLDLGENNFHGVIPDWVGESFHQLRFLRLHSNLFFGNIPSKLTQLNNLQVLDLANNSLSGPLPRGLYNFTSMSQSGPIILYDYASLNAINKGLVLKYDSGGLSFLKSIDLSYNNLIGEIPPEIVVLAGLLILNLSHNHLIGKIPLKIGNMTSLESLDFHMNNLSGTIPQSMSALHYLEVLNFSYNNLFGSIPTGDQLQALDDPSIYSGNPGLCGYPLKTSCDSRKKFHQRDDDDNSNSKNDGDRDKWLYLFIEFGFVTGFLVVFFILLFKVKWRYTYFYLVDSVIEQSQTFLSKQMRTALGHLPNSSRPFNKGVTSTSSEPMIHNC